MERAWATVFEQTDFVKPLVCESALLPCIIIVLHSKYDGVSVPACPCIRSCNVTLQEHPACCGGVPVHERLLAVSRWPWQMTARLFTSLPVNDLCCLPADRSFAAMHPDWEGLKYRSDPPISQQKLPEEKEEDQHPSQASATE